MLVNTIKEYIERDFQTEPKLKRVRVEIIKELLHAIELKKLTITERSFQIIILHQFEMLKTRIKEKLKLKGFDLSETINAALALWELSGEEIAEVKKHLQGLIPN